MKTIVSAIIAAVLASACAEELDGPADEAADLLYQVLADKTLVVKKGRAGPQSFTYTCGAVGESCATELDVPIRDLGPAGFPKKLKDLFAARSREYRSQIVGILNQSCVDRYGRRSKHRDDDGIAVDYINDSNVMILTPSMTNSAELTWDAFRYTDVGPGPMRCTVTLEPSEDTVASDWFESMSIRIVALKVK